MSKEISGTGPILDSDFTRPFNSFYWCCCCEVDLSNELDFLNHLECIEHLQCLMGCHLLSQRTYRLVYLLLQSEKHVCYMCNLTFHDAGDYIIHLNTTEHNKLTGNLPATRVNIDQNADSLKRINELSWKASEGSSGHLPANASTLVEKHDFSTEKAKLKSDRPVKGPQPLKRCSELMSSPEKMMRDEKCEIEKSANVDQQLSGADVLMRKATKIDKSSEIANDVSITQKGDVFFCDICQGSVESNDLNEHIMSKEHVNNLKKEVKVKREQSDSDDCLVIEPNTKREPPIKSQPNNKKIMKNCSDDGDSKSGDVKTEKLVQITTKLTNVGGLQPSLRMRQDSNCLFSSCVVSEKSLDTVDKQHSNRNISMQRSNATSNSDKRNCELLKIDSDCTENTKELPNTNSSPDECSTVLECKLCNVVCSFTGCFEDHKAGQRHHRNVLQSLCWESTCEFPEGLLDDPPFVFRCDTCPKPLSQLTHNKQHIHGRDHIEFHQKYSIPESFSCLICKVIFTDFGNLQAHSLGENHLTLVEPLVKRAKHLAKLRKGSQRNEKSRRTSVNESPEKSSEKEADALANSGGVLEVFTSLDSRILMFCHLCKTGMKSWGRARGHCKRDTHRAKLENGTKQASFTCRPCCLKFISFTLLTEHVRDDAHRKAVIGYKRGLKAELMASKKELESLCATFLSLRDTRVTFGSLDTRYKMFCHSCEVALLNLRDAKLHCDNGYKHHRISCRRCRLTFNSFKDISVHVNGSTHASGLVERRMARKVLAKHKRGSTRRSCFKDRKKSNKGPAETLNTDKEMGSESIDNSCSSPDKKRSRGKQL